MGSHVHNFKKANEKLKKSISWVKGYGGKVIFRINNIDLINKKILPDYYTLKGHDSAGRHHSNLTTIQILQYILQF